eukprot:COSAG05_NODE_457_length_9624_cov_14.129554_3_plen_79_part_00
MRRRQSQSFLAWLNLTRYVYNFDRGYPQLYSRHAASGRGPDCMSHTLGTASDAARKNQEEEPISRAAFAAAAACSACP